MDPIVKNRQARFSYAIEETFTAGIQLLGTEVKSIREGKANLSDSYCILTNNREFCQTLLSKIHQTKLSFICHTLLSKKFIKQNCL